MTFRVRCECGATLKVKDQLAGKTGTCPACYRTITLQPPEPTQPREPIPHPEPPLPWQSAPGPLPTPEATSNAFAEFEEPTRSIAAMRLVLNGKQKKSVEVDGNTVRIIKEAGIFSSKREKAIPIRNITSVEVKKPGPMIVGFIQFSIAGGKARDSSYTLSGGAFDAVQDENSVVFADKKSYDVALRIKEYVENYSEPQSASSGEMSSTADEIRKLKALLDEGILAKDEFDAKKKQLLPLLL